MAIVHVRLTILLRKSKSRKLTHNLIRLQKSIYDFFFIFRMKLIAIDSSDQVNWHCFARCNCMRIVQWQGTITFVCGCCDFVESNDALPTIDVQSWSVPSCASYPWTWIPMVRAEGSTFVAWPSSCQLNEMQHKIRVIRTHNFQSCMYGFRLMFVVALTLQMIIFLLQNFDLLRFGDHLTNLLIDVHLIGHCFTLQFLCHAQLLCLRLFEMLVACPKVAV